MPRTKGTKQLFVEVTDTLLDEFKAFCDSRNETMRASIEMAMRRHMANPPPPPVPQPLPPLVPLPPVGVSDPTEDETKEQTALKPTAKKKGKK